MVEIDCDDFKAIEKSDCPLGGESFGEKLEVLLGRIFTPKKRGPKMKEK